MAEHRGDNFVLRDGQADQGIGFDTFVLSLATTALIHLGAGPDPDSGQVRTDLVLARQSLELLELLFKKTTGNLTPEEAKLFQSVLTDLRLKFVAASKP